MMRIWSWLNNYNAKFISLTIKVIKTNSQQSEVKRFPMKVFDEVDLLVQVYENYVSEQGLPYVSADEQDFNEITEDQVIWIEAFQTLWDKAQ